MKYGFLLSTKQRDLSQIEENVIKKPQNNNTKEKKSNGINKTSSMQLFNKQYSVIKMKSKALRKND